MLFLLDTNILINLVAEPREELLLDRLKLLAENKKIDLLIPEVLLEEWNNKKKLTIKDITRKFYTSTQHSNNETLDAQFQDDLSILYEKVRKIDSLIESGIQIPLKSNVKIETVDRSRNRKAPFHGDKTKSINDALIFFSAIDYLEKNKFEELVFVTRDISDYGNPQKKSEAIHPELENPSLNILFFPSLGKCLQVLIQSGKIPYQTENDETIPRYGIKIISQGNKNLLEYLYEVLLECQRKMRFIPPDIFCRIHPFRVTNLKYSYTYYTNYVLHTNNSELINFFKEVDVNKCKFKSKATYRNTKSNLSKLTYVIEILNRQLIFVISDIVGTEDVQLRPENSGTCKCPRCTYTQLKWRNILSVIAKDVDLLKKGYVNFELGQFSEALILYHEEYKKAKKEGNKVLSYQLQFMLKWLQHYASFEKNEDVDKILKELEKIDHEKEYFSFANSSKIDQQIAKYFHSEKPLQEPEESIKEIVEKIRDHYNSQLRASYSSNSNCWNLLCEFSVFEEFTIANGMPYTKYSNFERICKDFTEGIFLSHALNEYQVNRLKSFTDHILKTLLRYGNADHMIRLYNNYIKKDIPYQEDDGTFKEVVLNFLGTGNELINQFEETKKWNGSIQFYKIYWNLVLLLTLVKFENSFIVSCFDRLFSFLSVLPKRERHKLNHLASFIESKGKILGKISVKKVFNLCLVTPALHNDILFDAFANLNNKQDFALIETEEEFDLFCKFFLDKCEKCDDYHQNIVFTGHSILSNEFKVKFSSILKLRLDEHFDLKVYYFASLFEIIDYRTFFKEYLNLFRPPSKERKHFFDHLDGEIKFRHLNELMNLVFKNKIRLQKEFIMSLKGISDYYDWLLDMKNFDYNKFNPIWIIQYATTYYLRTIFTHKIIRMKVKDYLKKNYQPTLAFYYTQYVK